MIGSVSSSVTGLYDPSRQQEFEESQVPPDHEGPATHPGVEAPGAPSSHPGLAPRLGDGLAAFPSYPPASAPAVPAAVAAPATIGGAGAPSLQQGKSQGPSVSDLKGQLNVWRERQWKDEGRPGYPKTVLNGDGKFDAATRDAVKAFQRSVGLPQTGIADAATQNVLKLENDRGFATGGMREADRMQVRALVADASQDGKRLEGLTKLFSGPLLSAADWSLVTQAATRARGDAAFTSALAKLTTSIDFKDLSPDQRSMVLNDIAMHPDTATVMQSAEQLGTPAGRDALLAVAGREWAKAQATIAPADVEGRNTTAGRLTSATGPIPPADWNNPALIVGKLTQNATGAASLTSETRCGPSTLLAGALLHGPDVAAKYIDTVAEKSGKLLTAYDRKAMHEIADRVRHRSATLGDLSDAQNMLFLAQNRRRFVGEWRSANPAPSYLSAAQNAQLGLLIAKEPNYSAQELSQLSALLSKATDLTVQAKVIEDASGGKHLVMNYVNETGDDGLDDVELRDAASAGGLGASGIAHDPAGPDPAGAILDRLKPGESAVLRLSGTPTGTQAGHFVSVGILGDGRPYVYNSDPFPGDATLVVGSANGPQPQAFKDELAKYSERAQHSASAHTEATRISY